MRRGCIWFGIVVGVWLLMCFSTVSMAAFFEGTYSSYRWYEPNIQDGISSLTTGPTNMTVTENAIGDRVQVLYDEGSGPLMLPEYQTITPNAAAFPQRNFDYGLGATTVDSLIVSDGNHMAMVYVDKEYYNPLDVSFRTSSWLRGYPSGNIDSLVKQWDVNYYYDPNLRNTSDGFGAGNMAVDISKTSADTILFSWGTAMLPMQVSGSRAWLVGGPVVDNNSILYQFDIAFDDSGFSFVSISTEMDDPSDVALGIGYASAAPVPVPGAVVLLGTGLLCLLGIRKRKLCR